MVEKEVNENQAVAAFLNDKNGGLPSSKLSLVFARSGVGKSSFAVNFGLHKALKGEQVLHFSVGMTSERVREYYHEVFLDLVRRKGVSANSWSIVEKNVTSITYIDPANLLTQMSSEIKTLVEDAKMEPALIIVDGINFHKKSDEKLKMFEAIAEKQAIPVLMTLRIHRNDKGHLALSKPLHVAQSYTDSLFLLDYEDKHIVIKAFEKGSDTPVVLPFFINPQTMLLNQIS